jgi:HEAT repeat protein
MFSIGTPNIKKLAAKRDVQGLIQALGYKKDADIRKAAAKALSELQDIQAVMPLVAALK